MFFRVYMFSGNPTNNWHFFSLCHETVSMVMVKINKRLSEILKRYKFWSSTDNWARSNAMASYSHYPSIYTTPRAVIYVFGARCPKNLTFWGPFLKIDYLGNFKATQTINPKNVPLLCVNVCKSIHIKYFRAWNRF